MFQFQDDWSALRIVEPPFNDLLIFRNKMIQDILHCSFVLVVFEIIFYTTTTAMVVVQQNNECLAVDAPFFVNGAIVFMNVS